MTKVLTTEANLYRIRIVPSNEVPYHGYTLPNGDLVGVIAEDDGRSMVFCDDDTAMELLAQAKALMAQWATLCGEMCGGAEDIVADVEQWQERYDEWDGYDQTLW
jgi:hypothetical protein